MSKIFHYLHEQVIGSTRYERIDSQVVECILDRELESYRLSVDESDKRVLVAFDGELLFGGLPKNAHIVRCQTLGAVACDFASMQKNQDNHHIYTQAESNYHIGNKVTVDIWRYFILLPNGMAVVRKYKDEDLSPIYVIINVSTNKKEEKFVQWGTTSS